MISDVFVKKAAHDALSSFVITNPEDIDIEIIAAHLGAPVLYEPLRNAEAMLIRRGADGLIYVDSKSLNRGRIRFAIAHELGHLQLHASKSQAWLCTDTSLTLADYQHNRQEIEANTFAAQLLMPTQMFAAEVESMDFSVSGVDELAKRYAVSLTAAARRFVDESRDEIMLVASEHGKVKWFHGKIAVRGCFLRTNQAVPSDSDAVDCTEGKTGHKKPSQVESTSWFPEIAKGHVLYEQSLKLGGFPLVLTFLSLELDEEEFEF